jgi:hypothetical protein
LLALAWLAAASSSHATDHADGSAAAGEPASDLTDLYAWMQDGRLVVALTLHPDAAGDAQFATDTVYALHLHRFNSYDPRTTNPGLETAVLCRFHANDDVECWAGENPLHHVRGDASAGALSSSDDALRIFAGLREDTAFFNPEGYASLRNWFAGNDVAIDGNGCPSISDEDSAELLAALAEGQDAYASQQVLALVLELDTSVLSGTGKYVGVWAGAHEVAP